MVKLSLLVFTFSVLRAAVIQGTVLENQSGHPVARATVVLEPVSGNADQRRTLSTNRYGVFEFNNLPAGGYLVTARRIGFAPAQFGQKRSTSAGFPIVVAANDAMSISLRLSRFGAIAGTVLDENDVGLPDFEVLAYRNTQPPQIASRAIADERGVFRISGLTPGSYFVRSAAKRYEDSTSYLPTFAREAQVLDQSFVFDVELDRQVERADVRPIQGRVFSLTVSAIPVPDNAIPPLPVTMTLVSELGRQTLQTSSHTFTGLQPGQYDLFLQAPLESGPGFQGDYRRISLSADTVLPPIVLRQGQPLRFTFDGAKDARSKILARRKDLAGPGSSETLNLTANVVQLPPGPWQLALEPNPTTYAADFAGPGYQRVPNKRADGWNDIVVGAFSAPVRFTLSTTPGSVHGIVKQNGEPVIGAPVFLESLDLEPAARLAETFLTHTDGRGAYQFLGLAPGNYRALSTFEFQTADSAVMQKSGAKPVRVEMGRDSEHNLDLFVAP